jgi:cation diffusion facilitator CzcD-associated flavoprotein CzcO
MLMKKVKKALGREPDAETFTPPYNPWDQRLCLVPDGDMFEAMKQGKADIVTDHIARFDAKGIQLKSGNYLEADTIVTATGLKLAMAGKIDFFVDEEKIEFSDRFYYKGCMFSNVPNMTIVFGYLNASWTLKVDIVARYTCRMLDHMQTTGTRIAMPYMPDPDAVKEETELFEGFSSGYVQRSKEILPKQGEEMPWRLTQDYLFERKVLLEGELDDGALVFSNPDTASLAQKDTIAVAAE